MSVAKCLNTLESLKPLNGIPTGIEVIDDFLVWRGIPKGEISIFQSQFAESANSIWRHMMDHLLKEKRKVFWLQSFSSSDLNFKVLQDLIKNSFFEVLTITTTDHHFLREDLIKVKQLAHQHQVSIVILCDHIDRNLYPFFSLILDCDFDFFTVRKALYRPTPFHIHSSLLNINFFAESREGLNQPSNPLKLWHQKRPEWLSQC